MNRMNGLSEDRHDYGICGIGARKLHVISKLVRRDALQYELAGISVLALVAFERNSQETNPDCNDESKSDYRQGPPCKLHELSVDVGLAHDEKSYFDEKRNVATEAGIRNFSGTGLEYGESTALCLPDYDRL